MWWLHKNIFTPVCYRYKKEYLMFNDDIQGTAATVLAGLYGAMKVQGLGPEAIKDQVGLAIPPFFPIKFHQ